MKLSHIHGGLLVLGLLVLGGCTSTEPSYDFEYDAGPNLPDQNWELEPAVITDGPHNQELRYLYDLIVNAYPFYPAKIQSDPTWNDKMQVRLGRDYSDYPMHGEGWLNTLNGMLFGFDGHISVMDKEWYAQFQDGIGTQDNTNPMAIALHYDPEGPYRDATIRIGGASGAMKSLSPPNIREDRGSYVYLRIQSFMLNLNDAQKWIDETEAFLRSSCSPGKPVIIDLRGNAGGFMTWLDGIMYPMAKDELTWTSRLLYRDHPLVKEWAAITETELLPIADLPGPVEHPEDLAYFTWFSLDTITVSRNPNPISHGGVYILQDSGCFSSSDTFLSMAKATGFATLVGPENSQGDGILQSPGYIKLPESRWVMNFSWSFGLNPDGTSNAEQGTAPDIRTAPGEDPLEVALAHHRNLRAGTRP